MNRRAFFAAISTVLGWFGRDGLSRPIKMEHPKCRKCGASDHLAFFSLADISPEVGEYRCHLCFKHGLKIVMREIEPKNGWKQVECACFDLDGVHYDHVREV